MHAIGLTTFIYIVNIESLNTQPYNDKHMFSSFDFAQKKKREKKKTNKFMYDRSRIELLTIRLMMKILRIHVVLVREERKFLHNINNQHYQANSIAIAHTNSSKYVFPDETISSPLMNCIHFLENSRSSKLHNSDLSL